jgi:hypothetical protein
MDLIFTTFALTMALGTLSGCLATVYASTLCLLET